MGEENYRKQENKVLYTGALLILISIGILIFEIYGR